MQTRAGEGEAGNGIEMKVLGGEKQPGEVEESGDCR
jgi:hypothetical protein